MPLCWPTRDRAFRRGVLAGALTLALTTVGVAGGAAASPRSGAAPAVQQECSPSQARVKAGSQAVEPNALSAAEVAAAERSFDLRLRSKRLSARQIAIYPRVTVPVVVHVITNTAGDGAVSDSRIQRQLNVLNQAFAGRVNRSSPQTLFRFRLQEINRVINDDWYAWSLDDDDDRVAKTALHRGGPETLNLYVAGLGDGLLGYATFPESREGALDGVVLLNETLPGGSAVPYHLGDTATHEVGHWLGLYHTFEDSCGGLGDRVADTPAQFDDSETGDDVYTCDPNLDTCPQAGRDPVQNFMNYVEDACMNRFTRGQAQRMALQWYAYRAPAVLP